MALRVLIVEDDPVIGEGLQLGLRQGGNTADWVRSAGAASAAVRGEHFDAIVLDLGLPDRSGLDWLREQRGAGDDTPVLILTAYDAPADRVRGLDHGADDYLAKPFDLDELAARLRALLRRRAGSAAPLLTWGPVTLDPAMRSVALDDIALTLTTREFALLEALLRARGTVLSREQLEQALYGWDEEVDSNALEVHIHNLRRKLGAERIRTVRGVGYAMAPED